MDNNFNGYSPENNFDPNGAPIRDDETMLADDFSDGGQVYGQNPDIAQNAYSQNPADNQYNGGYNGYAQNADYGQNANYGQNGGYNNNYPVTPVTPVNPPPQQDFSHMYDQMFNQKQGASGISITSLVMSIIGLVLTLIGTIACCCGGHLIIILGMLASAVGTVLGILNKIWKKSGSGLATAGIIIGILGLVWGVVMFALLIVPLVAEAGSTSSSDYYYY